MVGVGLAGLLPKAELEEKKTRGDRASDNDISSASWTALLIYAANHISNLTKQCNVVGTPLNGSIHLSMEARRDRIQSTPKT